MYLLIMIKVIRKLNSIDEKKFWHTRVFARVFVSIFWNSKRIWSQILPRPQNLALRTLYPIKMMWKILQLGFFVVFLMYFTTLNMKISGQSLQYTVRIKLKTLEKCLQNFYTVYSGVYYRTRSAKFWGCTAKSDFRFVFSVEKYSCEP